MRHDSLLGLLDSSSLADGEELLPSAQSVILIICFATLGPLPVLIDRGRAVPDVLAWLKFQKEEQLKSASTLYSYALALSRFVATRLALQNLSGTLQGACIPIRRTGWLQECARGVTTVTPLTLQFPSPIEPKFTVILNQDPWTPVILQQPHMRMVCSLLEKVESEYLSAFWEEVIVKESPNDKGLPFALAAAKGRVTLIKSDVVEKELFKQSGRKCSLKTREYLQSFSLVELQSALRAITPRRINDAVALLWGAGNERLQAFSLVQFRTTSQVRRTG
jgi:hypothetical protein